MAGQITELKAQKRNSQRVNVYVNGHFAFGLAAIEAVRLKVGQHLTDAEIARLQERDQAEVAYERALNFLSYRPRSVAEMQRYLTGKKFDTPTVDAVIARLSQVGLLDDGAFAQYWLENRDSFKPRGRRALRYELYDEVDAAYRAALSQAQKLARRRHDVDTFRSKLLAFLNRRGFPYYIARDTVDRLIAELGDE